MSDPQLAPFLAAYERGRLVWSLKRALGVSVFAAVAVRAGVDVPTALLLALVLVAATTFAGWRSRAGMHGAFAGVAVALVPLALGQVLADRCLCEGGLCVSWCGLGCGATAAVVGVGAGLAFSSLRRQRADFAAAALVCATLGILLCPATGIGSAVGAVVGALVGLGPVLVLGNKKALA